MNSKNNILNRYDIICIGAGSGGLNVANFMNRIGLKVLLIDKTDSNIGGDCLNTGCIPSKALIHIANQAYEAKKFQKYSDTTIGVTDLKKVMQYIKDKQNVIRKHENTLYFQKKGIDVVLGEAKFSGKDRIVVNNKEYSAKKIILATGSSPRKLKIPEIEKVDYLTNENIFELNILPKNFLIIGGGPIGIEIGQAFSRLGSKVTIIQNSNQFLPKEDIEISNILCKQLKAEGVNLLFETKTLEFNSPHTLIIERKGKNETVFFDKVLISIGRELNIQGLNLEKAGIEIDSDGRKLKVNDYLQTTNKNVYVCGDIAGSYQFTHAAELHAGILINNFFNPLKKKKLNYDNFSWVTYTSPEIATFGLNEEILKKRKKSYEVISLDFEDDDRAIVEESTVGKIKLLIHKDKILGGTMIAKNAGELIQELILAKVGNIPLKKLFAKIYPYPVASRINKKILSTHYSKKLTPFIKRIFKLLY